MLKITRKMLKEYSYNDWLDYFKRIPAGEFLVSSKMLKEKLPVEGYAAASRWVDIIQNPSKMDKLQSAKLKDKMGADIMEISVGDDDEAFYEALIRENVQQLNTSNISQQEVARITQNINIFRKELREIRSRKPKKGTVLEKVLEKAEMKQKRPKTRLTVNNRGENKASKTRSKGKLGSKTGKVSSKKEENGDKN